MKVKLQKKSLLVKTGFMRINDMFNGVIIVNQENNYHIKDKVERLFIEAKKLDINLSVLVNDGTIAKIDEKGNIVTNLKTDFVIYLDKDYYLAKLLKEAGYTLFNDPDFLKLCDDKMLTYITLTNQGIPMPKTFAAPLIYHKLEEENYKFLDKVSNELGFPLVVKRVYGSLGEGVFLADNIDELKDIYSKNYMHPLLFQSFIDSSAGRSIRVIVIDNEVIGAFERYNEGDFRSNFGKSASSKPIVLSDEYLKLVQKIASLLDIKYAGIDLLYGKDGPILCEINSNAFFMEFEKVTGINVSRLFLEMIIKNVKKS